MFVPRLKSIHLLSMGVAILIGALLIGPVALAQGVDKPDPVMEVVPWNGMEVVKGEVMVQFREGFRDEKVRRAMHERMNTDLIQNIADGLDRVKVRGAMTIGSAIEAYQSDPMIEFAEPNQAYRLFHTPNDPSFGSQWGMTKIGCTTAWNTAKGSASSKVAVVDTGVDVDHPDLGDHYAGGYDYYSGDSNPNDVDGHGSHCCGNAAAETNNSTGIAGVGYNCKFLAYRAGTGLYIYDSASVSSINAAKNAGALVISMSWGGTSQSFSIKNALDSAYNAGVVNCAAAGNDNSTQTNYPAGHSSVIAVAASKSTDARANFSNYGNWVDVAAPGVNIYSTWKNAGYATADGTSMATPICAGAALLLYDALGGVRSKANADIVRNALQNSADYVGTWVKYGRINVASALNQLVPPAAPAIISISPGNVQALAGGTITVYGSGFDSAYQLVSGGQTITTFTIVNDTQLTYYAPTASSLGTTWVTVYNAGGQSNAKSFNYIETSPAKDASPIWGTAGYPYTFTFGAGVGDACVVLLSPSPGTFNYQGYDILNGLPVWYFMYLNAAGIGTKTVNLPLKLSGKVYYHQILIFDPVTSVFQEASQPVVQTYIL